MTKKEIGEELIITYKEWKYSNYKGGIRLIPKEKFSGKDPYDKLPNGHKVIEVFPPGHPNGNSTKFPTYLVERGNINYKLVYGRGRGANKGLKAEDYLLESLLGKTNDKYWNNIAALCLDKLEINPRSIVSIYKPKDNSRLVDGNVNNVGAALSDITIETEKRKHYISLKNGSMWGVANIGAVNFLQSLDGRVIIDKNHILYGFLNKLGFSDENIINTWEAYLNNESQPALVQDKPIDKSFASDLLASSLGYGYLYCAITPYGEIIKNLTNQHDAYNVVGDIIGEEKYYPLSKQYPNSRKEIKNKIYTAGGKYEVRLRNSDGGILPNKCQINYCVRKDDIRNDTNGG